jgi:hypothetical protein
VGREEIESETARDTAQSGDEGDEQEISVVVGGV